MKSVVRAECIRLSDLPVANLPSVTALRPDSCLCWGICASVIHWWKLCKVITAVAFTVKQLISETKPTANLESTLRYWKLSFSFLRASGRCIVDPTSRLSGLSLRRFSRSRMLWVKAHAVLYPCFASEFVVTLGLIILRICHSCIAVSPGLRSAPCPYWSGKRQLSSNGQFRTKIRLRYSCLRLLICRMFHRLRL